MLLTIITFVVILSILVFIHEFGHFSMAKKLGIKVEEFGFGLPPRAWGKKVKGTIYSLNWLPIGGFVRLAGEDEIDVEKIKNQAKSKSELKKYFWARSKKERAAVLLAGVTMNFLLAVLIISFIFTQGVLVPTDRVKVVEVSADSPAQAAGIRTEDIIISFDNQVITTPEELISLTQKRAGQETQLVVDRQGEQIELTMTPRENPPEGQGALGVVISNLAEKKYPWYSAPFFGMIEALNMSWLMISSLAVMVYKLVTLQSVSVDVAGPVGIAQATGQAVKYGYIAVLQLAGILSLNLAILNLLPIPALDGGRLMFVVFEKFMGRKVKPRVEAVAHQVGLAFLLALLVLVTINDILRIIRG